MAGRKIMEKSDIAKLSWVASFLAAVRKPESAPKRDFSDYSALHLRIFFGTVNA
jgi:hypothetical protein